VAPWDDVQLLKSWEHLEPALHVPHLPAYWRKPSQPGPWEDFWEDLLLLPASWEHLRLLPVPWEHWRLAFGKHLQLTPCEKILLALERS
jgi:hypothetical protein